MSLLPSQSHFSVDIGGNHHVQNQHEVDHDEPSFSISQERLTELVQINDAVSLEQHGGILQIAAALGSNVDTGIVGDDRDIGCRRRTFGFNRGLEEENNPTRKSFNELVLEAFKDSTIILLLCCAMMSLMIGIKTNGPQQGLLDGAIVFLAIILVLTVGLMSRFIKARLMPRKLMKKHHKGAVSVIRRGEMKEISVSDLVVGDVIFLEAGNQVPADGFFIRGDSFKLDDGLVESGIKYISMFSGAKVAEGRCRMLVAAVGKNTERSKLIGTLSRNRDQEPKLQAAIDKMNDRLENLWLILSLCILSVQALRCFMQKSATQDDYHNPDPKGLKNTVEDIMNESTKVMKKQGGKVNWLVSLLCILLLATRDGLPLGILVLCFCSSRKMRNFGATVTKFAACITIGSITSICLCKTNALTLRHSEMAELWIGLTRVMDVSKEVNNQLLEIFREGIRVTSSGQVIEDSLLFWSEQVLGLDLDKGYQNPAILLSDRSCCMIVNRCEEENQAQMLHWKGAPNFILSLCSHYYDVDGTMQILDEEKKQLFNRLIEDIGSSNSIQCYAFARKKMVREESESKKLAEQENHVHGVDEETINSLYHGFALLGLLRLKIPYAPEVMEALAAFRTLGVNVKLVVDDDLNTARFMALNCGIFMPGAEEEAAILEASHFRNSSVETGTNIHVIANASPADNLLIVQLLRNNDEVVAICSSLKRDSPSLIEADVGILMDNHNAELIEEEADVIVGQNMGTIASIIRSGRHLRNQIEIFLQLHWTLNLSAFALNFVLEVLRNETRKLSSFHLLWTNLIVETLGAFALSMWISTGTIPHRTGSGPVITNIMWRNIAIQSLFQVTILLVLAMKGKHILRADQNVLCTMIFSCYVLCQVFALIGTVQRSASSSSVGGRKIQDNYLFFIILTVIVALQMLLVEIMSLVSDSGKLDYKKWLICIGTAAVSVPVGYAAEWVSHVTVMVVGYILPSPLVDFYHNFLQNKFCNLF